MYNRNHKSNYYLAMFTYSTSLRNAANLYIRHRQQIMDSIHQEAILILKNCYLHLDYAMHLLFGCFIHYHIYEEFHQILKLYDYFDSLIFWWFEFTFSQFIFCQTPEMNRVSWELLTACLRLEGAHPSLNLDFTACYLPNTTLGVNLTVQEQHP